MDKLDYKKEYKDLYLPKQTPAAIQVPSMPFFMVDGQGDPNEQGGEYQASVELLYALSYTIKMSKMGGNAPTGYFDYVMPPLEGLWWFEDYKNFDFRHKDRFYWTSMIRQPDFVTPEVFEWTCKEVQKKKQLNPSKARFERFTEGLCVQCMHIGDFDNEPATISKIEQYSAENGFINDIGHTRRHHEIYLSDPRKTERSKMKTVLRIPVRRCEE